MPRILLIVAIFLICGSISIFLIDPYHFRHDPVRMGHISRALGRCESNGGLKQIDSSARVPVFKNCVGRICGDAPIYSRYRASFSCNNGATFNESWEETES